jgi:hypothetical protein
LERESEFERRQEDEAAAEAAAIGAEPGRRPGRDDDVIPPGESDDPAFRAVEEAGGGEAEGFELAEAELVERAENAHGPSPIADQERVSEDARADREYGESDAIRTSEDDPDAPEDEG